MFMVRTKACNVCNLQSTGSDIQLRNGSYYLIISKEFFYNECYNVGPLMGQSGMEKKTGSSHKCLDKTQRVYGLEGKRPCRM